MTLCTFKRGTQELCRKHNIRAAADTTLRYSQHDENPATIYLLSPNHSLISCTSPVELAEYGGEQICTFWRYRI